MNDDAAWKNVKDNVQLFSLRKKAGFVISYRIFHRYIRKTKNVVRVSFRVSQNHFPAAFRINVSSSGL